MWLLIQTQSNYAYKVNGTPGTTTNMTILDTTDIIRKVLYQNKRITSETFTMLPEFTAERVRESPTERLKARRLRVSYTRLELYTGMQNDQPSLTPPFPT